MPFKKAEGEAQAALQRGDQMHIADIDFVEFYAPAFPSAQEAKEFVQQVESKPGPTPARIALHQGARMLWLADRMDDIARGREALQILFYLVTAEAVAKIVFAFKAEGKSKHYVQRFFGEICRNAHRDSLSRALGLLSMRDTPHFLTWNEVVDVLYDVRCDVVHEGQYYMFHLAMNSGLPEVVVSDQNYIAHITAAQLRQIVLEGVVEGVKKLIQGNATAAGGGASR